MNRLRQLIAITGVLTAGARLLREANPGRSLAGKVALITGGSRGLGLLLAREFGRAGCLVAICARDPKELDRARAQLDQWGVADVLTFTCDMAEPFDVAQLIFNVQEAFGQIDILVNNAGVIQAGPIATMTTADFEQAMHIMFWGPVHATMEVLPKMLRRGTGHIVNITSIGGKAAIPHLLPYAAAKFAATGFSEGLAAELAGTGVHVTTVIPGLMRTGSYLNAFFKGEHEREFGWFGLAANLPVLSMDAEVAASQVVRAVKRGDVELILTLPANILARVYGLMPGIAIRLFGIVNRTLLPTGTSRRKQRGMVIQSRLRSVVFNFLTGWGRSAARRLNQVRGADLREEAQARTNGKQLDTVE